MKEMSMATTKNKSTEAWVTVREYSRLTGVALATVYRLCDQNLLEHKRIGRSIRLPRSSATPDNKHHDDAA